jgi:hypothetical protein
LKRVCPDLFVVEIPCTRGPEERERERERERGGLGWHLDAMGKRGMTIPLQRAVVINPDLAYISGLCYGGTLIY